MQAEKSWISASAGQRSSMSIAYAGALPLSILPDIGKLELHNMIERTLRTIEVWAQLWLCEEDTIRIKNLPSSQGIVRRSSVMNRLHITVYHARRAMPGLADCSEAISITMPTAETRFMVLAPGGENPRPDKVRASRVAPQVNYSASLGMI
jgi:hypothetical protein